MIRECLMLLFAILQVFGSKSRSIRHYDEVINPIEIYSMKIKSFVKNRYAETVITSKVRNTDSSPQETVFTVILPKKALISKFVMTINDRDYTAYVKEKNEAKQDYENARERGETAAYVSTRDSNRFTVSLNVEALGKATFRLTYEELLERKKNLYELVININPGQPVKNLKVNVEIQEGVRLKMVQVPSIRSGNEIIESDEDLDPKAKIDRVNETCTRINFRPNIPRQKELAKLMNNPEDEGLSGQFVVQYDVERNGGEVLLEDGFYFIHFFAPPDMESLRKNVIFVLDTSGSMAGKKIKQLKSAMRKILNELEPKDKFSLIKFNKKAILLNLDNTTVTYQNLNDLSLPPSNDAIKENIKKAESIISRLKANFMTNIYDSLMLATHLANQAKGDTSKPQPVIVFLTDGKATSGNTDEYEIIEDITKNNKHKTPIYCLSFGSQAEKDLLRKISLKNKGFFRHIYEGGDAADQLRDFYTSISSPILNNVTFKYGEGAKDVTRTIFPIMYNGSEIVVVGKIDNNLKILPEITAQAAKGLIDFAPEIKKSIANLERLWAYMMIQQLLEEKEISKYDSEVIRNKVLNIALKYNFVTPVSSMVVVKPNSMNYIDLEDAGGNTKRKQGAAHSRGRNRMRPRKKVIKVDIVEGDRVDAAVIPYPHSVNHFKTILPWLNNSLQNDMLPTTYGLYKIDVSARSSNGLLCSITLTNTTGYCKYIHECGDVFQYLTSIKIFEEYQCELNGYAAICCPPPSYFES